ncbi:MAG: hypothetical protein ACYC4B_31410, partial [Pirellulaceae bacterium]
ASDAGSFAGDVDSGFYQSNESWSGDGTFDIEGTSNSNFAAGGITATSNGSYNSHEVYGYDSTAVFRDRYLDEVTLHSERISTGTADDNTLVHNTGHSTYTTLSSTSGADTTTDSTTTKHWQWNETSRSGLDGTSSTANHSVTETRGATFSTTYSCDDRLGQLGGHAAHRQPDSPELRRPQQFAVGRSDQCDSRPSGHRLYYPRQPRRSDRRRPGGLRRG